MKRTSTPLSLSQVLMIFVLSIAVAGCGSSGDGSALTIAEPVSVQGNTLFPQTLSGNEGDYELFPGQVNIWDLTEEFSIDDGGDDQFDGAFAMTVSTSAFPNQTYSDLTWYTPAATIFDNVLVAAAASTQDETIPKILVDYGQYYGVLNQNISEGRIYQIIDLTSATGTVSLEWNWRYNVNSFEYYTKPVYLNVVIRNADDGTVLETLRNITSGYSESFEAADLSAYAGQRIILSFETSNNSYFDRTVIDNVSITDDSETEFVTNGDFETGNISGWLINIPLEYQNVRSAEETLEGLTVSRQFFTLPNKLWGRWVDMFTNNTDATITTTVEYETDLGSDSYGVIYEPAGAEGNALSTWDGDRDDKDCGLVFGNADVVEYISASAVDSSDGDEYIYNRFNLTVEPGQTVSIVSFAILSAERTGESTTATINDKATVIDSAALDIVNNFWNDNQYRNGMTQEQIDTVINF